MNITMGLLRRMIRESVKSDCWGGSHPEEMYDEEIVEDDSYKKKSVYVPDDVKKSVNAWFEKMGLSGTKKRSK